MDRRTFLGAILAKAMILVGWKQSQVEDTEVKLISSVDLCGPEEIRKIRIYDVVGTPLDFPMAASDLNVRWGGCWILQMSRYDIWPPKINEFGQPVTRVNCDFVYKKAIG